MIFYIKEKIHNSNRSLRIFFENMMWIVMVC